MHLDEKTIQNIRSKNSNKKVLTEDLGEVDTSQEEAKPLKKRRRIPLIHQKSLVSVENPDPNYRYHLTNDEGDNIYKRLKAGWVIVDRNDNVVVDDVDKRIQDPSWKSSALSQYVGDNTTAYMMRIPMEYYLEDQAEIERMTSVIEGGIYKGVIAGIDPNETYGKVEKKVTR